MPAARKPAVKKVYAVVRLSYEAVPFEVGDELQDVLPARVLEACIERGEASTSKPAV